MSAMFMLGFFIGIGVGIIVGVLFVSYTSEADGWNQSDEERWRSATGIST